MFSCVTYSDVKTRCPSFVSLADKLHEAFMRYVELRDDRLSSVCFDRECVAMEPSDGGEEEEESVMTQLNGLIQVLMEKQAMRKERASTIFGNSI